MKIKNSIFMLAVTFILLTNLAYARGGNDMGDDHGNSSGSSGHDVGDDHGSSGDTGHDVGDDHSNNGGEVRLSACDFLSKKYVDLTCVSASTVGAVCADPSADILSAPRGKFQLCCCSRESNTPVSSPTPTPSP